MINFYQMRGPCRIFVVATCLAGALLFILWSLGPVQSSDFGQRANDEEKYSPSLFVAPVSQESKIPKISGWKAAGNLLD
jgi:hypothetical protein